jgi:hypothetical protein
VPRLIDKIIYFCIVTVSLLCCRFIFCYIVTLCKLYLLITKRVFLHYLVSDPKRVLFAAIWICAGGKMVKKFAAVKTSCVRTLTCSVSVNFFGRTLLIHIPSTTLSPQYFLNSTVLISDMNKSNILIFALFNVAFSKSPLYHVHNCMYPQPLQQLN